MRIAPLTSLYTMRSSSQYLLFVTALTLYGCGWFSHQEPTRANDAPPLVMAERVAPRPLPQVEIEKDAEPVRQIKPWSPRFIATGLACGIMIEFTGVKKDKPLHARYAGLELRRFSADPGSMADNIKQPASITSIASSDPLHRDPLLLSTTINDAKQAFFKVPPGKYLLRQTKEWADQTYIRDVEVREGNYSVISIPVRVPANNQP